MTFIISYLAINFSSSGKIMESVRVGKVSVRYQPEKLQIDIQHLFDDFCDKELFANFFHCFESLMLPKCQLSSIASFLPQWFPLY